MSHVFCWQVVEDDTADAAFEKVLQEQLFGAATEESGLLPQLVKFTVRFAFDIKPNQYKIIPYDNIKQLNQLIANGDDEELEELFNDYIDSVFCICLRPPRNNGLIEKHTKGRWFFFGWPHC